MKVIIDTEVLSKGRITIGEFLLLLTSYFDVNIPKTIESIKVKGLGTPSIYSAWYIAMTEQQKKRIDDILLDSHERLQSYRSRFFESTAQKMCTLYPQDKRGIIEDVVKRLKELVVYGYDFTEEDAFEATKEYVETTEGSKILDLKYFIYQLVNMEGAGEEEEPCVSSLLMTTIENLKEGKEGCKD